MNQHRLTSIRSGHKAVLSPFIGVVLLVALLTVALSGSALAVEDVGDDVTPDWVTQGEAIPSGFGYSVDDIGDVDGDGYDDVVVGSYLMNSGSSGNGKVYVYKGGESGLQDTPAYNFAGENETDWLGYSVSGVGDLNDDEIADFVASAPLADSSGAVTDTGKVYVYLGQNGASPQALLSLVGENANDQFGISVSGAGDVNQDGYDDIIVGAHYYDKTGVEQDAGKAYVYYGTESGIVPTATWSFVGENALDNLGNAVAGAGDVNSDGYDDVMVGAPRNGDAGEDAGKVYLFYGSGAGLPIAPTLTLTGTAAHDEFGAALDAAGDVNGDGYDDIVIGAYHNEDVGENAGKAYIFYGSASGILQPGVLVDTAERAGDEYGFAVDGAGDINGDGFDDVLVGAHRYDKDPASVDADNGKIYLYGGCIGGLQSTAILSTTADNTRFGRSVSSAGDVNKDGYDDILAGAWAVLGKAYEYNGEPIAVCEVDFEFQATAAEAGQGDPCTANVEIEVPTGTEVAFCYKATNKGTVPLAWNTLTDSQYGTLVDNDETVWQPDETRTYLMTTTVTSDIVANSMWSGGAPITTPDGGPTNPPDKELSVSGSSAVTVTVTAVIEKPDGVFLPMLNKE